MTLTNHKCIQELSASPDFNKSFDYPKMHYMVHLFPGIESKGPSLHYNSILGEGLHVKIKADARRTNGRDFEEQARHRLLALFAIASHPSLRL